MSKKKSENILDELGDTSFLLKIVTSRKALGLNWRESVILAKAAKFINQDPSAQGPNCALVQWTRVAEELGLSQTRDVERASKRFKELGLLVSVGTKSWYGGGRYSHIYDFTEVMARLSDPLVSLDK